MQSCNKILWKKYCSWQWSAFWEGRLVVGLKSHHRNIFSCFTNWKIHSKTLFQIDVQFIFHALYEALQGFCWWCDMPFIGCEIHDLNPQNTWIMTINFCQNNFLLWWWNLKKHDYLIWEKMPCDIVILGLPLGAPCISKSNFFVVILGLQKCPN